MTVRLMSNIFNSVKTADFLKSHDNFLILTHDNPDGDTLGSGFALCFALRKMGKKANVLVEELPLKYAFIADGYEEDNFNAEVIISVDMAAEGMFGEKTKAYMDKIDLCIDHHGSNSRYAKNLYLVADAAANCENIYKVIKAMGVSLDKQIATCLYTGIATDTGCFKFSNVTTDTHIFAGELLTYGVDHAKINFSLFEQKSKERMAAEKLVLESLEYYKDGKLAVCAITEEIINKTGVVQSEFDAMVGIPRSIAGVEIGITLKQRDDGFKISLRSSENYDVSGICAVFGGGGHLRAAGCFIKGDLEEVKAKIVAECEKAVG